MLWATTVFLLSTKEMYMKYLSFYQTRDRFEIFVLLSVHCVVDGYEPDHLGRIYFRFRDKEKCEKILHQFLSRKLRVYAHDMINAMRDAQAIFNSK